MYARTPAELPESRVWRPAHTHPSPPALWHSESVSAPGSTRPINIEHQDAGKVTNVAIAVHSYLINRRTRKELGNKGITIIITIFSSIKRYEEFDTMFMRQKRNVTALLIWCLTHGRFIRSDQSSNSCVFSITRALSSTVRSSVKPLNSAKNTNGSVI